MNSNFDFLADTCAAGQTLVRLVSRGNAILAELLRLSQNIPPDFKQEVTRNKDIRLASRKYDPILFDFKYLQNTDLYEDKVENSPVSTIFIYTIINTSGQKIKILIFIFLFLFLF